MSNGTLTKNQVQKGVKIVKVPLIAFETEDRLDLLILEMPFYQKRLDKKLQNKSYFL